MSTIKLLKVVLLSIRIFDVLAVCGIGLKPFVHDGNSSNNNISNPLNCTSLTNYDILRSLNGLAFPIKTECNNITVVQDTAVCEDDIQTDHCIIWSTITSTFCDHYGSIEFEKYWSKRGCKVTIYQHFPRFKGNHCDSPDGGLSVDYPNIIFKREGLHVDGCFNCFYKSIRNELSAVNFTVDVLKIQNREGVNENFDGIQYTILSDLYLHTPSITKMVNQIVFSASINTYTLVDFLGREAEHAWNMWATRELLSTYGAFSSVAVRGRNQPLQFSHLLEQARLDPTLSSYRQSFRKIKDEKVIELNTKTFNEWKQSSPRYELRGDPPDFCKIPNQLADDIMQEWIKIEMRSRCHPFYLAVPCDRTRQYDGFVPCPHELMNHLAQDYASLKGWCDFNHLASTIPALNIVDSGAKIAFQLPHLPISQGKRLAFFFTVYTDHHFLKRLLNHLYSAKHYYLFHIDPVGSTREFEIELRKLAFNRTNIFFSKDVPIVYGASTATILLTKAMAWFHRNTKGWDYFVPLTGSDYPLLPLHRIEKIFNYQKPEMPFVMAWSPGTSTHIFRLEKTVPIFENDPYLKKSIKAVTDERGKVLGAVPMEYRSGNFGPPLFCNNKSSFYHLDNRFNKSNRVLDSQWLFPRDVFPKRGRAYTEEDRKYATPSFDGVWRVWKKSDPATTGAYDRLSVEYIVENEEGRKYFHFFKQMLLGSEEHYYVSLLYNWNRTRSFVQTLSAEIVWNTWLIGLWERSTGGFQTHTHFLTLNEWDILKGFSMRGMMFARKFSSTKTAALIDKIDEHMLFNISTDAGLFWPGFYEVDITSPGKTWVANYRKNQSLSKRLKHDASHALSISVGDESHSTNVNSKGMGKARNQAVTLLV